jgi:hypothetical protein
MAHPNHAAFSPSATAATAVEVRADHRNRTRSWQTTKP